MTESTFTPPVVQPSDTVQWRYRSGTQWFPAIAFAQNEGGTLKLLIFRAYGAAPAWESRVPHEDAPPPKPREPEYGVWRLTPGQYGGDA